VNFTLIGLFEIEVEWVGVLKYGSYESKPYWVF